MAESYPAFNFKVEGKQLVFDRLSGPTNVARFTDAVVLKRTAFALAAGRNVVQLMKIAATVSGDEQRYSEVMLSLEEALKAQVEAYDQLAEFTTLVRPSEVL